MLRIDMISMTNIISTVTAILAGLSPLKEAEQKLLPFHRHSKNTNKKATLMCSIQLKMAIVLALIKVKAYDARLAIEIAYRWPIYSMTP